MEIHHVSRSTIAVTEQFTPGKKIPIEDGLELVFLAARLMGGEFRCLINKHVPPAEIQSRIPNNAISSGTMSTSAVSESAATQNALKKWPA